MSLNGEAVSSAASTYKLMAMELARYNIWQNDRLLEICGEMSEADLAADRGMFFGSLLGTLNHILHVDLVLLDYVRTGDMPDEFDAGFVPCADYSDFERRRKALDLEIKELFDERPSAWFDETFAFPFGDDPDRRRPRALFISQMFNHQTHHRSQLTTEFHRLGIDYGVTDLPYNPLSQS